jgi:hypothetical protein
MRLQYERAGTKPNTCRQLYNQRVPKPNRPARTRSRPTRAPRRRGRGSAQPRRGRRPQTERCKCKIQAAPAPNAPSASTRPATATRREEPLFSYAQRVDSRRRAVQCRLA